MSSKEERVVEIPLENLIFGKGQIRLHHVGAEIDDLAQSIRIMGQLEPILVAPSEEHAGKFEILAGQRRFLAHERLHLPAIKAIVREPVDEYGAKAISLTENLMRRDVAQVDKIDACTTLFKRYGSVRLVSDETGIPERLVRQFVKYDQLDPALRSYVDKGLKMQDALRIQQAASVSGTFSKDDAIKLVAELPTMSGAQQEKLLKERTAEPDRSIDDLLEEQKTSKKVSQIVVTLLTNVKSQLEEFAREEDTTQDDAARRLIEEGLTSKGYLDTSE